MNKTAITAMLILAIIAGLMLTRAAYGTHPPPRAQAVDAQQATREVVNDDGTTHRECNPSRHRLCTPYATEAYRRECDSNHLTTKPSELDGRHISLDAYIKEIDKLDERYRALPGAIADTQAAITLATNSARVKVLMDQETALQTELDDLNSLNSGGVSRIVDLRNKRDSVKPQRNAEMNAFKACAHGQPVFHTAPNFCPKQLPDGRIRYTQANCRR